MSNAIVKNKTSAVRIDVEYCGACDYGGHCLALAETIKSSTPNATILCKRGRQGSNPPDADEFLVFSYISANNYIINDCLTHDVRLFLSFRGYWKEICECSFEVVVNDKLIYSKLQTMALPDYGEVAQVVNDVSHGDEPREIKGQQPINCAIM